MLRVLLLTENRSEQLENISYLINTSVLISPDVRRLNSTSRNYDFDILHVVGEIKEDEKGEERVHFNGKDEGISSQEIVDVIKNSNFKLVFLSCENSASFATKIFPFCDTIFVAKKAEEGDLWKFTYQYYTDLVTIQEKTEKFRPRKAFQESNYSNSGYGYLSLLSVNPTDVQDSIVIKRNVSVSLEFHTAIMLFISVLITLVTVGLSFVSFLMEILR